MDIENMSIEKATERCKALTNPEQGCWIGISNQKAIETVLSELERIQNEKELHIKLEQQYKKEYLDLKAELEKKENIIKALVDYLIEGLQTKSYEEKICMEDILNKIENLGYEFENPCNMRNMFKNVTKLEKIEWKNKVEREGK